MHLHQSPTKKAGSESTFQKEAAWLLFEKHGGKKTKNYEKDLKELSRGTPLAYLIGNTPFLGTTIDLSHRTLIPRVETEYWVEKAIDVVSALPKKNLSTLDVFSGSGCIGIAAFLYLSKEKNIHITFLDSEENALAQIEKNIFTNKVPREKTRVLKSDVFSALSKSEEVAGEESRFDVIFANPPYLSHTREGVQDSVLFFEPHQALFAPDDGLSLVEKTITNASKYLVEGGLLFCEFDTRKKKEITNVLKNTSYQTHHFWHDQYKKWRTLIAIK